MEQRSGFGERVRFMRLKRNYTMEELSEILDISVSHMGLLEREERSPSYSLLIRLGKALGASFDYLLSGGEPKAGKDNGQIFVKESEVEEMRQDTRWLDVDKEAALGMALGRVLKRYKLDEDKLSYIYAAVAYIAKKIR